MMIDEAIRHCREKAEKLRKDSVKRLQVGLLHAANDCEECASEHEQLAEWLTELKQRREAEPVKHSKWICVDEKENVWMCDNCWNEFEIKGSNPYEIGMIGCPYCLCRMDGGAENG